VKVILTCGHPESGYHIIHEALVAAGLARTQPSSREAISPTELQQTLLRARDLSLSKGLSVDHGLAEEVWHDLAIDLFMGNSTETDWGWADAGTIWLLEFWKSFDPNIRFVLVYSAPEITIAEMLQTMEATPDNISRSITSWTIYNTEILRFYNRNPEHCMLVNATAATREPTRFIERAVATIGARIEPLASEHELTRPDISVVALSLVKALLGEYHHATALYQELESSGDFADPTDSVEDATTARAWHEYMGLLDKLKCAVEERREQHKRTIRLQIECGSFAQALKQAQGKTDELASQLSAARASLEANQAPSRSAELAHENEPLRFQVLQLQKELEYSVLKCGALESDCQNELKKRAFQEQFLRHHVINVVVDMLQEIEGDNWYYVEHDGRWAGPNEVSSIRMPALGEGTYKGQIDVTDSMAKEILRDMEFFFNGRQMDISKDWDTYPALVLFLIEATKIEDFPVWEFQFRFPKLICPAHHGSEDRRNLAIKVRSVKLDIIS
jgi:hypothetical protein